MLSNPLVSIVIPSFNHANYLCSAIESVLTQSYGNIELIVIDDGSTDNSLELLKTYGSRIKCFSQENVGQAKTLDIGWSLASGVIISYLSADDMLHPQAVEMAVIALKNNSNISIVYPDFDLIDSSSRHIRTVNVGDVDFYQMFSSFYCSIGPGAFMLRTCYEHVGSWNPLLRQMPDFEFWLRCSLYYSFFHLPHVLASFRVHPNSQTYAEASFERAQEPLVVLRNIFSLSESVFSIDKKIINKATSSAYLLSSQLHIRSSRFFFGTKYIIFALCHYPLLLFSGRFYRAFFNSFFNRLGHSFLSKMKDALNLKG